MPKDLPSLNAIRFFDCAARHLSFTKAGDELNVTQGAVSKQIKLLEEQIDCQLFIRKGPYLKLTTHGEHFQATVSDSLRIIRQGLANLRRDSTSTLVVSVLPSFASYWLIPRTAKLEKQEPWLSLRLASSYTNIDFSVNTDIDVGIRMGAGKWAGLYSEQLTQDRMFPVCTPKLASKIKSLSDMKKYQLLSDMLPYDEWPNWFDVAGASYKDYKTKPYDDTGLQIGGAIEEQGVALCREDLVSDYLNAGVLVKLFDVAFVSKIHYYFICREHETEERKIKVFREWLQTVK